MNTHIREDMNEQEKCSICHEQNCNTITNCEHYFHRSCLEQWVIQSSNCPVCSTTINLESNEVEVMDEGGNPVKDKGSLKKD